MGARLRVFLKQEEDLTLFELRAATTVPQKVKDRAQVIRLNSQGWYVEKIAAHEKLDRAFPSQKYFIDGLKLVWEDIAKLQN